MKILAIDPGPELSAYVIFQWPWFKMLEFNHIENEKLLKDVILLGMGYNKNGDYPEKMIIEIPEARSQPLGKDTLMTIFWASRFMERWLDHGEPIKIEPRKIRSILTGDTKSSNKHIKSAVVDRVDPMRKFGQFGKGTKKAPGPLYGFSNHFFSALAVGLAWIEKNNI